MKLEIKNEYIAGTLDLLHGLPLERVENVHRNRIIQELGDQLEKIQKEFNKLYREHAGLSDDEEIDLSDDKLGKNKTKFIEDRDVLYNEVFTLQGKNFEKALETIKKAILNSDEKWKGNEAVIYAILYEQFMDEE